MELREARFKKRITQLGLYLKTGINQAKICHFERGYMMPRNDEKKRIAEALEVDINDLDWLIPEKGE